MAKEMVEKMKKNKKFQRFDFFLKKTKMSFFKFTFCFKRWLKFQENWKPS
jgi:hypothetical protein